MSSCHGDGPSISLLPNPSIPIPKPIPASGGERAITVAIVGPPNSGKSTLFNRLTGLRQKVANFPGVTVEHRKGRAKLKDHHEVILVDLPGVYSLHARSEDERVTRDVLKGEFANVAKPDAVILILDATNLGRHLVLAAPIISLGLPTLILLNMADDLELRGGSVDVASLAADLGAPVALISATKGTGIDRIQQFLIGTAVNLTAPRPPRIELPVLQDVPKCRQWATKLGTSASYRAPAPPLWTRRLDAVFLHPVAGPIVFLAVVVAVFQSIFSWAQPMMDGLKNAELISGQWISSQLPDNLFRSLLIDGIWSGVGSVVVFLPQILLLFLFIGILEDSGYLARAALIADRTMAKFGLQGKSFIPLLSAYACAVPAVMSTRVIENKRDRIATMLIAPLMTCSARLPIYTLIRVYTEPSHPARRIIAAGCHHAEFVRARFCGGGWDSKATEIDRVEKPQFSAGAGDAALSLAHTAVAQPKTRGSRQVVSAAGRYSDSIGGHRAVGAGEASAQGWQGAATGAQLCRHGGQSGGTRHQAAWV